MRCHGVIGGIALTAAIMGMAAPAPDATPDMGAARREIYKRVGRVELTLFIYEPDGSPTCTSRAAIVFFFGGGWTAGSPAQFRPQAERLASRGMVAMCADYRVASRHGVKAAACVEDAKSAIRWVRSNAARLGIDPRRIVAAGGSAGGHLAACAGVVPGFDAEGEDLSISSRPDAMVLFNPPCVLAPVDGLEAPPRLTDIAERLGVEPKRLSPHHHVRPGLPPCLVLHGTADMTVPYRTADMFAEAMTKAGNRCELAAYEGQPHGFFNAKRGDGPDSMYRATLARMEQFLESLGYLSVAAAP